MKPYQKSGLQALLFASALFACLPWGAANAAPQGRQAASQMLLASTDDPLTRARFGESLNGQWRFAEGDGLCQLERHPVAYGTARFVTTLAGEVAFELVGVRDLLAAGPVRLNRVAPAWHPLYPLNEAMDELNHVAGVGVSAADAQATRMLMDLYAGFHQVLHNPGFYDGGSTVQVQISAINFRAAYRRFMACFQRATANLSSFAALDRTRVLFAVDKDQLSPVAASRLEAIAKLVLADPAVSMVYIDGHTDSSGAERHNQGLSKRRAQAVAAEFQALGVPKTKLLLRFHAHRYPIASNATVQGKQQNRRTTVRLVREAPSLAAN
jgi:outer membrane protein OmpA-like peptidoglycan-associated protein